MKKLFFMLLCVLIDLSAKATVYTVCNEPIGLAQFDQIQQAIDAASAGDTIYVHGSSRPYDPFNILNKRLTIIGPGWRPDKPLRAVVDGALIRGAGATGTEIQGLVFEGQLSVDAFSSTIPLNLRIIRNEFSFFNLSIGETFAIGKTFENFLFEGNYFNNAGIAGENANKHRGFVLRNNLFTVANTLFRLPNSDNFQIDHNLFYQLFEQTENEISSGQFFLLTNNIFNGVNMINTSNLEGVSFSTFRNNITFDVDNTASPENIAPWTVNNNIDGGGNIANANPQMADQNAVDARVNNPLLDFTIATGPADSNGSDGKDIGLLFHSTGTLNWNESRNSTLPRVLSLSIQQTNSQDTLRLFVSARKRANTPDFLEAEYFLNSDPGIGLGVAVDLEQSNADSISFSSLVPLNGLSEGTHQLSIRVQLASGIWSLFETVSFLNPNDPPVANAGSDQVITLPQDSVFLDGFLSFDPDGFIIYYRWTKVSGPEQGTIDNSEGPFISGSALAKNLAAGTYQFELTVFDNSFFSALDTDTVTIIVNSPPVANAGPDNSTTLPANNITLNGTGSFDPDGVITSFQWRGISGPSGSTIQSPGQGTTLVSNLSPGEYTFELTVTDNHGATNRDTVNVTMKAASIPPVANAGADQVITLPQDSVFLDGFLSFDPDGFIIYYRWTKVSGPEQGTIDNSEGPFISGSALAKDLAAGTYQFELTVFDNSFFSALDTDTVTIIVNSPPVANAGPDKSTTLPSNNITLNGTGSFDPDGVITSFQWRSISGPSGSTIQSPGQGTTLVSNLSQGVYTFELTVTDNRGETDSDTVKVTVQAEPIFPVANAGTDKIVVLPTSFLKLDGRASLDPDGDILTFAWRKVSGPAGGALSSPTQAVTFATNLAAGIYQFELRVTDDSGLIDTDIVKVTVTNPPVANAGTDKTITLPTNSVALNGSSSFDPDGTIVKFLWSKISGPSGATITSPAQAVTSVKNLAEGIYQFRLVVTDNLGGSGSDVVQVTVNGPATRVATASRISNSDNSISTSGVDDEHQSIKVYPNPFREKINVTVPVQCSGVLVDVLGRILLDLKLSAGANEISTDRLEPGFYYLHIGRKAVRVQRE